MWYNLKLYFTNIFLGDLLTTIKEVIHKLSRRDRLTKYLVNIMEKMD